MRFLILIACIVIIVAVFSTQNSQPVSVSFFAWNFEASLAIVVFLSVISGVVLGVLVSFLLRVTKKRKMAVATKTPEAPEETPDGKEP
jgi:uncharacterized integral membrane protein